MNLTAGQIRVLVAQEQDRQELQALKHDSIETAEVRAFIEQTPGVTRADLSRWLCIEQSDLDRQLGYVPGKDGRIQQRMQIPSASRIVIALGRAPHELDGC